MTTRPLSQQSYEALCEMLPAGVSSPVRAFLGVGKLPVIVERAEKDLLVDVDGHEYIDFCASWGAHILGHADPRVLERVTKQLSLGSSYGTATYREGLLAKKIITHVPSIEKLRFCSSGTEATMSATRLARGYTGRDVIVKFTGNYHGSSDHFLVEAGSGLATFGISSSSKGVPIDAVKNTLSLPYNDTELVFDVLNDPQNRHRIAAVIIEPIAGNMGLVKAKPEFLQMLRSETKNIGALLIFDEVISGFRVGLQGAQGYYGITPDLTCLGKIIGGGFPQAAFGGKAEIMDQLAPLGAVYQSGTLSGNPVAMEAGLAVIEACEEAGFYEDLSKKTEEMLKPVQSYVEENNLPIHIPQVGSMFGFFFGVNHVDDFEEAKACDKKRFYDFFNYCFERGVYIPPSPFETSFVMKAHSRVHLEKASEVFMNFIKEYGV